MNILTEEKLSRIILKAINVLLIKYPERTGYGILLGSVFYFFTRLFSPLLKDKSLIDIDAAPFWGWIPLGIILTHLPFVIWSFFHRSKIDDNIDSIISVIEKSNTTEVEKRQLFRKLINKCVSNVILKENILSDFQKTENYLNS